MKSVLYTRFFINNNVSKRGAFLRTRAKSCGFRNDPKFVRGCTSIVSKIFNPHFSYVEFTVLLLASSLRQRLSSSRPRYRWFGWTGGAALQRYISPQSGYVDTGGRLCERRRDCKINRDHFHLLSTFSKQTEHAYIHVVIEYTLDVFYSFRIRVHPNSFWFKQKLNSKWNRHKISKWSPQKHGHQTNANFRQITSQSSAVRD